MRIGKYENSGHIHTPGKAGRLPRRRAARPFAAKESRGAIVIPLSGFIEIDVHNMTRTQAITAIDAWLRRANASVYRLRVIHGYRGGTALRDAVRARYKSHPKVKRIEIGLNPGETDLVLREL